MNPIRNERNVDVTTRAHPALSSSGLAKSLLFLAAGISLVASVGFYFTGDQTRGIFVGLWVPSILSAGALMMAGERHE